MSACSTRSPKQHRPRRAAWARRTKAASELGSDIDAGHP
jgi:hypothetical protein